MQERLLLILVLFLILFLIFLFILLLRASRLSTRQAKVDRPLAWMPMQKKKPNKISHTHKDE